MVQEVEGKKTPLYSYYQEKGVKLVDFGGWDLPIQFTKIGEEHEAVRNQAGLFDVSHMGEISVRGEEAESWLNTLVTNDVTKMQINQAQYNTMVNESGGTLDDLILFRIAEDHFWVTPNAANTTKIWQWMTENNPSRTVELENLSEAYGLIALQGPLSEEILQKVTEARLTEISTYHFLPQQTVAGIEGILLSRTGYTGEDGFELYVPWDETPALWNALLEAGADKLKECGLGARDTLRLEAGMALYGHELSEEINPLEGGVGFAVKVDKDQEFIGQQALKQQKTTGVSRISRGFELLDRGIAREGYPVLNKAGEQIGVVTSGTKSLTLNKSIGMMLVDKKETPLGEEVLIQVRKKTIPALVRKKDFLKSK
jgi:aminomethyltransferase